MDEVVSSSPIVSLRNQTTLASVRVVGCFEETLVELVEEILVSACKVGDIGKGQKFG